MSERPRDTPPRPPEPPEVPTRIRVPRAQALGIAALAVFPLLALLGLLDGATQSASASNEHLGLTITYPDRLRYKKTGAIKARITNRSEAPLELVTVSFPQEYIAGFSNLGFSPPPSSAFEVHLADLRPGETRSVSVEFQAERFGRHAGAVTAAAGDASISADLATFVIP